ncbi:T9SS type A sorting domain-containing protein [Chryseobacterium sp. DT-3]|uniref:T9SS type A sorting domain-containing protein n=1 Tax=Chryseobacterium sp. DT-3 TaxID=3396164 RepID=UPI003F1DF913
MGTAGFSAANVQYTSIAITPNGIPYIGYLDSSTMYDNATVMKYNSTNWATVGTSGFSAGAAYFTSLVIAPDGTPYIGYMDYNKGGRATVMKFNGINWTTVGTAGFSGGAVQSTSLAIAPDGSRIILGYFDQSLGSATFAKYYNLAQLSTKENSFQKVIIYPNPTKREFNIQTKKKIKSSTVSDISGKVILTAVSEKVDLSALPKGVYMINIHFSDDSIASEKIIKE